LGARATERRGFFKSFLGEVGEAAPSETREIPLEKISPDPDQPRRYFSPEGLQELAASIRAKGILQPLLLRPAGDGYVIVFGERRYRAARMAGLDRIPAMVRESSDTEAAEDALLENLQREDLNAVEETEGILRLLALRSGLHVEEVVSLLGRMDKAQRKNTPEDSARNVTGQASVVIETFKGLGKRMTWRSFVKNRLPLLNLPEDVLAAVRERGLEYTKARAIARVDDAEARRGLVSEAVEGGLSLSAIRRRVEELGGGGGAAERPDGGDLHELGLRVGRRVAAGKVPRALLADAGRRRRYEELLRELDAMLREA